MRLAILGSYSTQILTKSIRNLKNEWEIYEADYSQIDFEIYNDNSHLYRFKPDVIVIHETSISFKRNIMEHQILITSTTRVALQDLKNSCIN